MTNQEKSFIECCFEGSLNGIKNCIKYEVNIHIEDDWCIEVAVRNGHSKLVKFLLENGITHESACNKRILSYASDLQDIDLVRYLISKSDEYKTDSCALSWAAAKGNIEIGEMLLVYLNEFNGVFCSAAEAGQVPFIEFLINNGIQDIDKGAHRSPYWAAEKKHWLAVKSLLDNNIGKIESLGNKYLDQYLIWKNKSVNN